VPLLGPNDAHRSPARRDHVLGRGARLNRRHTGPLVEDHQPAGRFAQAGEIAVELGEAAGPRPHCATLAARSQRKGPAQTSVLPVRCVPSVPNPTSNHGGYRYVTKRTTRCFRQRANARKPRSSKRSIPRGQVAKGRFRKGRSWATCAGRASAAWQRRACSTCCLPPR
jgi:hypothetical protein